VRTVVDKAALGYTVFFFELFCFPLNDILPKLHAHVYFQDTVGMTSGKAWKPSNKTMIFRKSGAMEG
jgi:hypothetical protein